MATVPSRRRELEARSYAPLAPRTRSVWSYHTSHPFGCFCQTSHPFSCSFSRRARHLPFHSDLVVNDPRRLATIFGLIDLEVREKCRRLFLKQLEHRDRAAADLELRALAGAKLQHRPPGTRVGRHDDFRLGGIR